VFQKVVEYTKYLDRIGQYKKADQYFNRYIQSQSETVSKDDFVKMINDALHQGTDQDPSTPMSQYKPTNTPGTPKFDLTAYKAQSRQIMESAVASNPLFGRFNQSQKELIFQYLDSFAQDPNKIHDDTSDDKKLNDLLRSLGFEESENYNTSVVQQGLDRLDTAIWLAKLAKNAGFDKDSAVIAVAIVFPESDANPNNVSDVNLETWCWGPSVGLWQTRTIKELGCQGPNDNFRYDPDGKLFDPQNNANAAYKESRGGRYWHPWTTYNKGLYKPFLEVAQKAVNMVYH